MRSVSTTEIARQAGVSQPTVSDILNGRWRQKRISPATSERVLRIVREVNYRPNRLVRSLLTGRSQTVALVIPAISGSFFPQVVLGVETEAKKRGYHVLLSHVIVGLEDEREEIEVLLQRRVDGLIIAPCMGSQNREKYRQLLQENVPLVFVNDYFEDVRCSAVVADDFAGAYEATRHLIGLGHRRIAHLAGNLGPNVTRLRIEGYRRALRDHGLVAPKQYVQGFGFVLECGYEGVQQLLKLRERPTAVFGANDAVALGGIKAALEAGLRVPQDIAFVGFSDDLADVWFHKVGMTSMRTDAQRMGREAMARLLEEMENPQRKKRLAKLPVELVVRESCGASSGSVRQQPTKTNLG